MWIGRNEGCHEAVKCTVPPMNSITNANSKDARVRRDATKAVKNVLNDK